MSGFKLSILATLSGPKNHGEAWRVRIYIEFADQRSVEVQVEVPVRKFVEVRDLVAAGLVLRDEQALLNRLPRGDSRSLAEQILGRSLPLPPPPRFRGITSDQARWAAHTEREWYRTYLDAITANRRRT